MKKSALILIILVCAALTVYAQTETKEYPIKLKRPFTRGEKFRITGTDTETSAMTLDNNGQVINTEKNEVVIAMDAKATVVDINEKGNIVKAVYIIESFTRAINKKKETILPRGKKVTALTTDKGTQYEIDGKDSGGDLQKLLSQIISDTDDDGNDDKIFGTTKPKKPGDCWDIDTESADTLLKKEDLSTNKEDISGKVCVERIVRVGKMECLEIKGSMTVNKITPPLPDGFTVETSKVVIEVSGVYPVDQAKKGVESNLKMTMGFSGKGKAKPEDPELKVNASFVRDVNIKYAYTK